MSGMRRALVFASAERYLVLPINLVVTAILARLFTPAEFGLTVLAAAIWKFVDPIRDFGLGTFLIQQHEVTTETTRTYFTVSFLITLVCAVLILAGGPWLEEFYELPGLEWYFVITSTAFIMGAFIGPLFATLRREMAFATLAFINILNPIVNACVTIGLGLLGYGAISFAWAHVASVLTVMLLAFYFHPKFELFRPRLTEASKLVTYGLYDTGRNVLLNLMDTLPYLFIGRILNAESVGLLRRATTLTNMPESVILSGLHPVLLPAFAKRAREGHALKEAYLNAVEHLTAVYWPALLMLIFFAHPIVSILLGSQWLATVPIVQIMCAAMLIWFPVGLTNPTLIAAGGVRDTFVLALTTIPLTIAIQFFAAFHGLHALAWSMFITVPLFISMAMYLVKRRLNFTWREVVGCMRKSAVVAILTSLGAFAALLWNGLSFDMPIWLAAAGMLLSGLGWLAGIWITDHPLLGEMRWFLGKALERTKILPLPFSNLRAPRR